jgi:HK97 family phage major capsid protein
LRDDNLTVTAITWAELVDLQHSVDAAYRGPNAAWTFNDLVLAYIRKLTDSQGLPIWQPSLQVGAPDTILGKPVNTDPNVAAVALSAKSVVFGDFSQYFVRTVQGIRFERSDDFAFQNDLVTFRCIFRADGDLVDTTGAVKYFAGNAA